MPRPKWRTTSSSRRKIRSSFSVSSTLSLTSTFRCSCSCCCAPAAMPETPENARVGRPKKMEVLVGMAEAVLRRGGGVGFGANERRRRRRRRGERRGRRPRGGRRRRRDMWRFGFPVRLSYPRPSVRPVPLPRQYGTASRQPFDQKLTVLIEVARNKQGKEPRILESPS